MEVDVPVDLLALEFSEVRGVLLRYVRIAIKFANDGAIFTLNQTIGRYCQLQRIRHVSFQKFR